MMVIPGPLIRHQQLIITIYGLYSRDSDHAVTISALISMLGDLGYDAPGVRSSVSRLKAKGVLKSIKTGNGAKYRLSGSLTDVFTEGDRRIFAPVGPGEGDGWVLAIFSVPESMRNRRHQLRTLLGGFGFGAMSAGVWIAPSSALERTRRQLQAEGLDQFVDFFQGDHVDDGDMRAKVARWWDLPVLGADFREFLGLYSDGAKQWASRLEANPVLGVANSSDELHRDAFRYYIPMLTLWRRFPYREPNLPQEYLPPGWSGHAARTAFLEIHGLIAPLAAVHARGLMG